MTLVAWKSGKYVYCLSHSTHQVSGVIERLTADSLPKGRKCDWCGKVLVGKK
jgi:hypothetical protein